MAKRTYQAYLEKARRRFASKVLPVDNKGCINFAGGKCHFGYSHFYFNRHHQGAHRVAWQFANGPIPNGLWVLHRCDNPSCVNVEHLFLGTIQDNNQDAFLKERHAFGESHGMVKLTISQVRQIFLDTRPHLEIATEHGITKSVIWHIKTRKHWRRATIDLLTPESP